MLFDVGTYSWDGDLEDRGSDWTLDECSQLFHLEDADELRAELRALQIGQYLVCGGIEFTRVK